jgi:CheY-like chemotaxis protein
MMGRTTKDNSSQLVTRHSLSESNVGFNGKVLLAEDTLLNQEEALEMLEALGCRVDIVDNGLKAVRAVSENQYDLVFMDCQMPVMDGHEATRVIRKREKEEAAIDGSNAFHTPVVVLTAHAMVGDRENCLAAGMDDYMSKPFTLDDLRIKLEGRLPKKNKTGLGQKTGLTSSQAASNAASIAPKALDNTQALQIEGPLTW